MTGVTSLERLARALELKLLIGFETEAGDSQPAGVRTSADADSRVRLFSR